MIYQVYCGDTFAVGLNSSDKTVEWVFQHDICYHLCMACKIVAEIFRKSLTWLQESFLNYTPIIIHDISFDITDGVNYPWSSTTQNTITTCDAPVQVSMNTKVRMSIAEDQQIALW